MKPYLNRGTLIIVVYSILAGVILWVTPAEKTLGNVIKYVFFHVSLTHASLYGFYLSAIFGLMYLLMIYFKKDGDRFGAWSLILGRITVVVWGLSVFISIFAMQLAWGEITLHEPLTIFVLIVFALAIGKELIIADKSFHVVSIANIMLVAIITITRPNVGRVMHPDDPIGTSDLTAYKLMSTSLTVLTFIAMILFAFWLIHNRVKVITA